MRQVVLDTETTGLSVAQGNRIIEIGCIELLDRRPTERHYHQYVNPQRASEEGALKVHGITEEFLQDKPVFSKIAHAFIEYVRDSQLVIHNAAFDTAFLDFELSQLGLGKITDYCTVLDSLELAREQYPGQKNSLDALCRRFSVDNSHRDLHGALLDAKLLAHVYLTMTGGQGSLFTESAAQAVAPVSSAVEQELKVPQHDWVVQVATAEEKQLHAEYLAEMPTPALWPDDQQG